MNKASCDRNILPLATNKMEFIVSDVLGPNERNGICSTASKGKEFQVTNVFNRNGLLFRFSTKKMTQHRAIRLLPTA